MRERLTYLLLAGLIISSAKIGLAQSTGYYSSGKAIIEFPSESLATEAVEAFAKTRPDRKAVRNARMHQLRAHGARHLVYVADVRDSAALYRLVSADVKRGGAPVIHRSSAKLVSRSGGPNDFNYGAQWNMQRINAPGAWEYTTGGTSAAGHEIVIGVIETNGFDITNEDLRGQYWRNPGEIPDNGIDDDQNGLVDDVMGWSYTFNSPTFRPLAHGAHVVATLAAKGNNGSQIAGLNWDASVLPLEVESIEDLIVALDYLTALRQDFNSSGGTRGAYVVTNNLSLGLRDPASCDDFPLLNEAFTRAGEAGILSVNGPANENGLITPDRSDVPAACASEYLVTVAAIDQADGIFEDTRFSPEVIDLAAPGSDFQSIDYTSRNNTFRGTSGATPHVAGTIALMYALDCGAIDELAINRPAEAARYIRDLLLGSVDVVDGLVDKVVTGGILDAGAAVEAVLNGNCLTSQILVAFEEGVVAEPRLRLSTGSELERRATLSETWNIHLYSGIASNSTDLAVAARSLNEVRAAEPNLRLTTRSREPSDPLYQQQDYAATLGLPLAWQAIYGNEGLPSATPVVTAVFDQNFDFDNGDLDGRLLTNFDEIAGNGVDDDANGYVDDAQGVALDNTGVLERFGCHGTAVTSLLAANANDGSGIAGVDWAGKVIPMRGTTLADWVRGADYSARIRRDYNQRGTGEGLIVSYLTTAGQTREVGDGVQVVELVADALLSEGILVVGAAPNVAVNDLESDFPTGSIAEHLVASNSDTILTSLNAYPDAANVLLAPGGSGLVYATEAGEDLSIRGTSASAALVAGSVALLYQSPCSDLANQASVAPRATAIRVRDQLLDFAGNEANLSIGRAAVGLVLPCGNPDPCSLVSLGANVVQSGSTISAIVNGPTQGTCTARVVDALGRTQKVYEDLVPGAGTLRILTADWPAGQYFLQFGEGKGSGTWSFTVVR